jgi:hypothetical protein
VSLGSKCMRFYFGFGSKLKRCNTSSLRIMPFDILDESDGQLDCKSSSNKSANASITTDSSTYNP